MTVKRALVDTSQAVRIGLLARLTRQGWPRLFVSAAVVVFHVVLSSKDYDLVEALVAGVCGAIAVNVIWSYFARQVKGLPMLESVVLQQ